MTLLDLPQIHSGPNDAAAATILLSGDLIDYRSAVLPAMCCILINARLAAKIRILDSHILHHYTPKAELSEPIYLGVLWLFR